MQPTNLLAPPAVQQKAAPARQAKLFTGAEAFNVAIDQPFELVNGKIVFTGYTGDEHGMIESELARHLGNFVMPRKLGLVLTGEVGLYTRYDPDTVTDPTMSHALG